MTPLSEQDALRVRAAVEELHRFFEAWFVGDLPDTPEAFAPVEQALAPGFVLVSPDGRESAREELLGGLRAAHGRQARPRLAIRVRLRESVDLGGGLALARYEEWHEAAGSRRGRLSSAVFRLEAKVARWLTVHETWLPD